ncbi:hypothetical protein D3C87_2000790 [compost metagenome]
MKRCDHRLVGEAGRGERIGENAPELALRQVFELRHEQHVAFLRQQDAAFAIGPEAGNGIEQQLAVDALVAVDHHAIA